MNTCVVRKLYAVKNTCEQFSYEQFLKKLEYGFKLLTVTEQFPSVKFAAPEDISAINLAMEYNMELMVEALQVA